MEFFFFVAAKGNDGCFERMNRTITGFMGQGSECMEDWVERGYECSSQQFPLIAERSLIPTKTSISK